MDGHLSSIVNHLLTSHGTSDNDQTDMECIYTHMYTHTQFLRILMLELEREGRQQSMLLSESGDPAEELSLIYVKNNY